MKGHTSLGIAVDQLASSALKTLVYQRGQNSQTLKQLHALCAWAIHTYYPKGLPKVNADEWEIWSVHTHFLNSWFSLPWGFFTLWVRSWVLGYLRWRAQLHLKDLARLPRLQLYIFLTDLWCSIEAHTLSSYTYRRVSPTDLFEDSWELFSVCAR